MILKLRQLETILEMLDGDEDIEILLSDGTGHSGIGIYASYVDYPDEGSIFLGTCDEVSGKLTEGGIMPDLEELLSLMRGSEDTWVTDTLIEVASDNVGRTYKVSYRRIRFGDSVALNVGTWERAPSKRDDENEALAKLLVEALNELHSRRS